MLTNARQLLHVELLFVNVLLAFDLTFPNFSAHLLSSADAFCQILVDTLEGTPGLRYIWSTLKPLLQGKILYAPDTPAARLLVKEVGSEQKEREKKNHIMLLVLSLLQMQAAFYIAGNQFYLEHIYSNILFGA